MTPQEYNKLKSAAAKIRNWYRCELISEGKRGVWKHLTQREAKSLHNRGWSVVKATVDEELDLDGI